jgi:hypothetical protein
VQYTANSKTNRITIYSDSVDGDVSFSGTDGGALGADSFPIPADTPLTIRLDSGEDRVNDLIFYVAADSATHVRIIAESD